MKTIANILSKLSNELNQCNGAFNHPHLTGLIDVTTILVYYVGGTDTELGLTNVRCRSPNHSGTERETILLEMVVGAAII